MRGTVSPEPCLVQVKFQPPFRRPSGDLPGLQIGPSDSTHPKPNSSPSGLMPAAHQFHISVDGPTTCPRCPNRNSGHSNLYCAWYVCLSSIHSSPPVPISCPADHSGLSNPLPAPGLAPFWSTLHPAADALATKTKRGRFEVSSLS